jgi:hypothetical protein
MPGVGLAHGPPAEKKQAAVTTGPAEHPGIPCAMVLRCIRDLPGDRLSCPRRSPTHLVRDLGLSTGRPEPHDLTVRIGLFVGMIKITLQPDTPTASRTNVRDDREAPLLRSGTHQAYVNF